MFMTVDLTRLPFPSFDEGVSAWDVVEIGQFAPFFMVGVTNTYSDGETTRSSFFLGSFRQLSELIETLTPGRLELNYVNLIGPRHMTGGAPWELHHISKVYQAQEPKHAEYKCRVYESFEGRRFIDSVLATDIDDLGELTMVHSLDR